VTLSVTPDELYNEILSLWKVNMTVHDALTKGVLGLDQRNESEMVELYKDLLKKNGLDGSDLINVSELSEYNPVKLSSGITKSPLRVYPEDVEVEFDIDVVY